MKRTVKRVFWIYALLFVMLIVYLCKVSLFDSRLYITNSYNPRLSRASEHIKRGDILDINGQVPTLKRTRAAPTTGITTTRIFSPT